MQEIYNKHDYSRFFLLQVTSELVPIMKNLITFHPQVFISPQCISAKTNTEMCKKFNTEGKKTYIPVAAPPKCAA